MVHKTKCQTSPPPPPDTEAHDLREQAARYEREASRYLARAADLRLIAQSKEQ